MKQFKMTLFALLASSIFLVSCGKKSAADLAKSHCQMMKDAGTDMDKMKSAVEKIEKEVKESTKDMKQEDAEKFAKEYLEASLKCDPTKK